jgi:lipopolysaccharide export LptBFGC system permease protein LptF
MFRLDRAILREMLPLAFICLLGLTFLFATVGLFQIVNRFEVTPRVTTLLAFWPVLWKSLLPMTLPISLTFAAAMVYGRMRAEGELLVLSSAGVSPWRHYAVLLPLGLICGAISFYAASELGPDAYARRFALTRQALSDFVNYPPGGARELRLNGLDMSYADARDGRVYDLTLILHSDEGPSDQQGLLASLSADEARIRYDTDKLELVFVNVRNPRLVCFDPKTGAPGTPHIEVFGGDTKLLSPAMSASQIENLRYKYDFGGTAKAEGAKALGTFALLEQVEREATGKGPSEASGELVRRAGLGFAGLLLPLLGALLASLVNHPNRLLAIAAGVIPGALLFFPLMTAASGLARGGFDVTFSYLLAPLVVLAVCGFVLQRHMRGRWL